MIETSWIAKIRVEPQQVMNCAKHAIHNGFGYPLFSFVTMSCLDLLGLYLQTPESIDAPFPTIPEMDYIQDCDGSHTLSATTMLMHLSVLQCKFVVNDNQVMSKIVRLKFSIDLKFWLTFFFGFSIRGDVHVPFRFQIKKSNDLADPSEWIDIAELQKLDTKPGDRRPDGLIEPAVPHKPPRVTSMNDIQCIIMGTGAHWCSFRLQEFSQKNDSRIKRKFMMSLDSSPIAMMWSNHEIDCNSSKLVKEPLVFESITSFREKFEEWEQMGYTTIVVGKSALLPNDIDNHSKSTDPHLTALHSKIEKLNDTVNLFLGELFESSFQHQDANKSSQSMIHASNSGKLIPYLVTLVESIESNNYVSFLFDTCFFFGLCNCFNIHDE